MDGSKIKITGQHPCSDSTAFREKFGPISFFTQLRRISSMEGPPVQETGAAAAAVTWDGHQDAASAGLTGTALNTLPDTGLEILFPPLGDFDEPAHFLFGSICKSYASIL